MLRRFLIPMAPCLAGVLLASAAPAYAQTKLLRFPDVHGDPGRVRVRGRPVDGAVRGRRRDAADRPPGPGGLSRFSPDGRWIAFTGQYDGDEQVYVVPAAGGVPRQLTWYPARGPWRRAGAMTTRSTTGRPTGRSVLFRSLRYSTDLSDSRLFLVSTDGGLPAPLPMPESGGGDLSPDGARVVYSPLFRDFRTWKRYEGGWAQELYVFDRETHDVERITDHPRADRDPMWIGDAIYFTSDRDGTLNLYAFDLGARETAQLTTSTVWDVRWPGDDGRNRIVYEMNGELHLFAIDSGESRADPHHGARRRGWRCGRRGCRRRG